ncbi:MAG TPA: PAS domain-containing protein [Dissulfurispiraceae bacterium]|nr:PAS domain-containing protein [Dissulfurispiraceae bacterium]
MGQEERSHDEASYEIAYLRAVVADLENKSRQSEELLQVVTAQYRHITEVVSDYIFSVHMVDGNPVETVHGRGCLLITGYSQDEFASNNFLWINMVYEEDRPFVLKHVAGIISGKETAPFEHRIARKDGTLRWVKNTPVCQYDTEGKLIAYDGLIQDITERKQAQEALRKSEEKYRIVADFTCDWEEWMGPDGQFFYVSPACEIITGYRPEEFLLNPDLVTMIAHPSDQAMVAAHYNDSLSDNHETHHFDFRIITKTGEERWISHSCRPVFGSDGKWLGRRASNHDISSRHALIEDLMKARESEAVGMMARGIAHDFNNLLTAILGNISVARKIAPANEKLNTLLANAEEVSLHAAELTQKLLNFSRRGKPSKKKLNLADLIRRKVVPAVAVDELRIELMLSGNLHQIEADESQLNEALASILMHCRETLNGKGLLKISASNVTVKDKDGLKVHAGDYVRISVTENGISTASDSAAKIFDPLFAFKDIGVSLKTGLDLAITHSTVTNHDGVITVSSKAGEGTAFDIYLPAAKL